MWVEETKNGKYKYCERYTDYLTGKEKKISVTLEKNNRQTWKTAQGILAERIAKAVDQTDVKSYTLKEIVEEYRKDQIQTVKQSTYRRNINSQDAMLKLLGENTLADKLTAKYIRDKLLLSGKKTGTLNEYIKRFRPMIRWAYRSNMIQNLECIQKLQSFKDTPYREKIAEKFLEADEVKTLLESMDHPLWNRIAKFMILSGLRIGEVISLDRSDIDFDNKKIHVTKTYDSNNQVTTTPKTLCSIRDVDMQPELEQCCHELNVLMLERRLTCGIKPTLFLFTRNGTPIEYYTFNKYLKNKSSSAIGRKITSHTLRHTHASLLFEKGVSIDVISRRLGHENSTVTRKIYLHITEKLKEKDTEILKDVKIM